MRCGRWAAHGSAIRSPFGPSRTKRRFERGEIIWPIWRRRGTSSGRSVPPAAFASPGGPWKSRGALRRGTRSEIFDEPAQLLDVTAQVSSEKSYLLQVSGTALQDAQIANGDYVLIDPDGEIEPGDLIVACERGTGASERGAATLKRFYKERNRIELRPANAALESRYIAAEEWEREWAIQGKVKALYRFFDRP